MKKLQYPKCPYCGKRVNPLMAFILKSEGEYRCTKCSGISNIELDSQIYKFAVGIVLTAAAIFVLEELFIRPFVWYLVLFLLIPFLVFYLLSPSFVRLKRPVIRRQKMERRVPNSVTGGVPYGPHRMDDPTVYVPPAYGGKLVKPAPHAVPRAEEPTIQMSSQTYGRQTRKLNRQQTGHGSKAGQMSLQQSLNQFEEDLGENAQPVFYSRPESEINRNRLYRAPLDGPQPNDQDE